MDDRRKLFIRSSDEKIGDDQYFAELNRVIEDDNVIRTVASALRAIDVPRDFLSYPIPKTEHQKDLQELSVPIVEKWLMCFAEYIIDDLNQGDAYQCSPGEVYHHYKEYLQINGHKLENAENSIKLGIKINQLFPTNRNMFVQTAQNGHRTKTFHAKEILRDLTARNYGGGKSQRGSSVFTPKNVPVVSPTESDSDTAPEQVVPQPKKKKVVVAASARAPGFCMI